MSGGPTATVAPNFFVIGAQKAGTTRLCTLLDRHPGVQIPTKEPMYFQSEAAMSAKADWYRSIFDGSELATVTGDGSTYYSMSGIYPGTARRLHDFNPQAKIIYLVRHPLRRIESAWRHLLAVGEANSFRGFERTLMETPLLIDPTLYWQQLGEYRKFFPDNQITIQFFEEFVTDEERVANGCLSFLGLPPTLVVDADDQSGRNGSAGRRRRLAVVDAVRMLDGYERFKKFIPQSVKTVFTDYISRPVPSAFTWPDAARLWVTDRIRDDSAALLAHAGRDPNYWPLR